ncbi:MAG: penicillin-binding protein 2 [Candidatus Magasanikbacteria bacterium]
MKVSNPFSLQPKNSSNLDGKYKLTWVEESFSIDTSREDSMAHTSTSHVGSSFSSRRTFFLFLVMALFCVGIIGRLLFIQILSGHDYFAKAEDNRQRIIPIPSERGLIFDRNGSQLTYNIPNFSLALIPQDLPRKKEELAQVISSLSQIIGKDPAEIKTIIDTYKNYQRDSITIEEDIPYEIALRILSATELPGIHVQRGSKRLYVFSPEDNKDTETTIEEISQETITSTPHSISHVLGYIGKLSPEDLGTLYTQGYLPSDSLGKTGVEKSYEPFLRGTYGRRRVEVNAQGTQQQILAEESPVSGSHLTLSIDNNMQIKLEEIVQKHLKLKNKNRSSAIVLNPQNGEILALVSMPAFDNNDFSGGIDSKTYQTYISDQNLPLFNRSIGGTYPSGSVIKPAMASAALQEKIITPTTSFLSNGGLRIGAWFFPDWLAGGHGMTNVRKSLAWSVNTFYYYIGGGYGDFVGLGVERIAEYLKRFGFSAKTGIDIPGEVEGFLPSMEWKKKTKGEQWYVGDTYNLSIGQGDFLTTPLQIAMMTSVVANGGTLYQPRMIKEIINPETNKKTEVETKIIRSEVVDPLYLQTVRAGMNDCVILGSCWMLRSLPFSSGGKTGTAQWSSNKDTHAWFTSFAPLENAQIVVTILVEEGGEGSLTAEPIAAEFYQWWSTYKK